MRYLVILLSAATLVGCSKGKGPGDGPQNPIYNEPLKFEILGLQDTTMEQTDTLNFNTLVQYVSGTKENVALAVANLPVTMTAGFYPDIDTPDFASVIRLITHSTDTGTYNIKVIGSTTKSSKEYTVRVRVLPQTINPATALAGNYLVTGMCSSTGTLSHAAVVSAVSSPWNRIQIQGFWKPGIANTVFADIDPAAQTLTIPAQISNNVTISGSGSYTATEITVNYTVSTGATGTDNCTTVLTKQ
jgi:hypothetical protein